MTISDRLEFDYTQIPTIYDEVLELGSIVIQRPLCSIGSSINRKTKANNIGIRRKILTF